MIDPTVYATWMGVWAERLGGKPLSQPTSRAYYAAFSRELTTAQFDAAMQLVFTTHRFNTWPSPAEIIAAVKQTPDDAANAAKAYELVIRIITGYATPGSPGSDRAGRETQLADTAGAGTFEAYSAAGGWQRFRHMTEDSQEFVRKEFLEHFASIAQRTRASAELRSVASTLGSGQRMLIAATHDAAPAGGGG